MTVDDRVDLAVDAAVDRMDQAVAVAAAGLLEEGGREDPLAAGREHDVDRVVHPAGHHRLDRAVVGPRAEDVRRLGDKGRASRPLVGLFGERPLAPVDPAVGPEIGPVQVVGAAGERLALEPLLAAVGHAVAVGIGQLPDARRRRDVERAREPQRSLGKHHLVGEDGPLVEPAVAVAILEPEDPVRLVLELHGRLVVRARRLGDVEPALLVEVGHDRPVDERRPGGELDGEAVGEGERVAVERDLARLGIPGPDAKGQRRDDDGDGDECPSGCGVVHAEGPSSRSGRRAVRFAAGAGGCSCGVESRVVLFDPPPPIQRKPRSALESAPRGA